MSSIIEVNNLSKSFTISHEGTKESYTALRDVVSQKTRKIFSFSKSSKSSSKEDFWALKDVSFNIEQGDRVGIIGRNGAGKSTLLKILSRITEPTSGEIRIKGRVASLLEVGTGFHPELTGRENIFLNGAILGMSRQEIRKKFEEIVDFAEVEKFLDTPVKRYSSGMYVRLAFAVAAHLEPEILVVDEVLAVGDAQFQKKCLGKMEDVSKNEGRTVLFVSHNMSAIQTICNKGIYLSKGVLKGIGDIQRIVYQYLNDTNNKDKTDTNTIGTLILRSIDFSKKEIKSLDDIEISIKFEVFEDDILHSLVLLINKNDGQRIAIVDFRKQIASRRIFKGQEIYIKVKIKAFPFLQGDYDIGFYYQGERSNSNVYNLLGINVLSQITDDILIPYDLSLRGFVELNYEYETLFS